MNQDQSPLKGRGQSYLFARLISSESRDFGLSAIKKQAIHEGFGSIDSVDRACAWKVD